MMTFPGDVEPVDESQHIRLADQSEPVEGGPSEETGNMMVFMFSYVNMKTIIYVKRLCDFLQMKHEHTLFCTP